MHKEIYFSEPYELAEKSAQYLLELQKVFADNADAKRQAEQLLSEQAGLTEPEKERLLSIIKACEESMAKIKTDQEQLKTDIGELVRSHLSLANMLKNFEPKISH